MYRHRPDVLSLVFGILFTTVGVLTFADVSFGSQVQLLLPLLGAALGLAVIGSLISGSPKPARSRMTPAPVAIEPPPSQQPNDPFFDSPIDPDLLEEAYREVFGDDDPASGASMTIRQESAPEAETS